MRKIYDGIFKNVFVFEGYDRELMDDFLYDLYRRHNDDCNVISKVILSSRYERKIIEKFGHYEDDSYLETLCDKFVDHGYRLVLNKETNHLEWVSKKITSRYNMLNEIFFYVSLVPLLLAAILLILAIFMGSINSTADSIGGAIILHEIICFIISKLKLW